MLDARVSYGTTVLFAPVTLGKSPIFRSFPSNFDTGFALEIYFSLALVADINNLLLWIKPTSFALTNRAMCLNLRDSRKSSRKF